MLKRGFFVASIGSVGPAAFGRLCVETYLCFLAMVSMISAAFGRLCVETCRVSSDCGLSGQPPSGGCVLKLRRVHEES